MKFTQKKVINLQHVIFASRKEGKFPYAWRFSPMVRLYKAKPNVFSSHIPFPRIWFYDKISEAAILGFFWSNYILLCERLQRPWKIPVELFLTALECSKLPKKTSVTCLESVLTSSLSTMNTFFTCTMVWIQP